MAAVGGRTSRTGVIAQCARIDQWRTYACHVPQRQLFASTVGGRWGKRATVMEKSSTTKDNAFPPRRETRTRFHYARTVRKRTTDMSRPRHKIWMLPGQLTKKRLDFSNFLRVYRFDFQAVASRSTVRLLLFMSFISLLSRERRPRDQCVMTHGWYHINTSCYYCSSDIFTWSSAHRLGECDEKHKTQ